MSLYEPLVRSAASALAPLADALEDPRELAGFLTSLGWQVPVSQTTLDAVNSVLPVRDALRALPGALAALDGSPSDRVAAVQDVADIVAAVAAAVKALAELDETTLAPFTGALAAPEAWGDLASALPDYLLGRWLEREVPALFGVLRLTGLCVPAGAGRDARYRFRWDQLGSVLEDPAGAVAAATGWNSGRFPGSAVQQVLAVALARLGLRVRVQHRSQAVADAIAGTPVDRITGTEAAVLLFSGAAPSGLSAEAGVVFACTQDAGGTLYVGNLASGDFSAGLAIDDDWSLQASGAIDGTATMGVRIQPAGVSLVSGSTEIGATLALTGAPAAPWILVGSQDGIRVELDGVRIEVGVAGTVADPEAYGLVAVDDGALRLVIDLAEGDSFLRGAIGDGLSVRAGGTLRWGTRAGLSFSGGAGLEITVPLDLQAGPLAIDSLTISLGASDAGARIAGTIVGGLVLGPLVATVEGIGAALELTSDPDGNMLSGLDARLALVPPTGLGIGVDAEGVVTGGGFISFDRDEGRYSGVVSLQMLSVGLTAIGIVETEVDGDPDAWSLFLSVVADFTPIQLGFGFMLNGVGGFMGLHRTFDQDALAEGAREGRLDSLLFPEDPLADAPRILTDIAAYFPNQTDTHVFGAMARLVWGVPTIVSAELGLILTVPDFELAVVGELEAILPDPHAPILELHMSVVGYVDVSSATFWIAASIYDSKLVGQHLSGDMAMFLTLGQQPYFLLSVGGFNPGWDAPAVVPSSLRGLRRMSASIDLGDSLQAGLDSYFALTSNTLQFGAEVWAVARARIASIDFTAEGWFGFDVLIVFTPFSLVARMDAGVTIKAEGKTLLGVQLSLRLEGPKPWYATGEAAFKFLGFEISFRLEVGGRVGAATADTVDLWTLLEAALADPKSWIAPAAASEAVPVVGVRAIDGAEDARVWMAPDGAIAVRQQVLPLDRAIEAYGEFRPDGEARFDVESAGLGPGVEADWTIVEDWFAPSQYTKLSKDERLTAPSFESMHAGATIGGGSVVVPTASGNLAAVDLGYEEWVLEDDHEVALGSRALPVDRLRGGAVAAAAAAAAGLAPGARRSVSGIEPFAVAPTRYALVDAIGAVDTGEGSLTFADAAVVRRSKPAPLRIVPTYAAGRHEAGGSR